MELLAIIASRYNTRYVDAMLQAAKAELKRAGAGTFRLFVYRELTKFRSLQRGWRGKAQCRRIICWE